MFETQKALLQSRTFWSAVLVIVAALAQQLHWSWLYALAQDPATIDAILRLIAAAGALGAIVFRALATARITTVALKKK